MTSDILRHPRGLPVLFFTEMWERASYYGMRALLVLFLAAAVSNGGMGLDDKSAAAIYGVYTASVYLAAMPGGWIADRLLGMKNAVFYGGCIIAAGHFTLALPWNEAFYFGLVLIVLGTGLLKPCISTLVGELYRDLPSAKRDAGFSIYYMGINIGAIIGSLVCGYLGEHVGWHYGFAAAGIGMVLGLVQFRFSGHTLDNVGNLERPTPATPAARAYRKGWQQVSIGTGVFLLLAVAVLLGFVPFDVITVAGYGSGLIAALAIAYFCYIYFAGGLDATERDRMKAAAVLFTVGMLFWAGFEQAGSSFNLFAQRFTERSLFNFEFPASWFQSVNAFFVVTLAPFFAAFWVKLGARNLDPSSPVKFALGMLFLGAGFGVMALASEIVVGGQNVLPTWLILTYLLHTMGELCLSPVGLSLVTRLAPRNFTAQMMGLWFMFSAMGNLIAGLVAGHLGGEDLAGMPVMYGKMLLIFGGAGLALLLLRKPLARWMGDIR